MTGADDHGKRRGRRPASADAEAGAQVDVDGDDGETRSEDGEGAAITMPDAEDRVDIASLTAELEAVRADAARLHEDWLRALAEADNTRKRSAREIEEQTRRAREQVLAEFLAVVDDVERALAAIAEPAAGDADALAGTGESAAPGAAAGTELDGIVAGVRLIRSRFLETLGRFDVKPMASEHTPFDPHLHEAVMRESCEGLEPDHVVRVLQKGYWIGDRVLRPARVVVSG